MKIKIGQNEIAITQLFDTAEKRSTEMQRQITVYLEEAKPCEELQAIMEDSYTGNFILEKENGDTETFNGFVNYVISRDIESGSEQTSIRFQKVDGE